MNMALVDIVANLLQTILLVVLLGIAAYHLAKGRRTALLDLFVAIMIAYILYNAYWITYLVATLSYPGLTIPIDVLEFALSTLTISLLPVAMRTRPRMNLAVAGVLPIMLCFVYLCSCWSGRSLLSQTVLELPYVVMGLVVAGYADDAPKHRFVVVFGCFALALPGLLYNGAFQGSQENLLYFASLIPMHVCALFLIGSCVLALRRPPRSGTHEKPLLRLAVLASLVSQMCLYASADGFYQAALAYTGISQALILGAILKESPAGSEPAEQSPRGRTQNSRSLNVGIRLASVLAAMLGGMMTCLLAGVVNGLAAQVLHLDLITVATNVSPVVEEFLKIGFLCLSLYALDPSPRQTLVGALFMGLGFACAETALMCLDGVTAHLVFRAVSANIMHVSCALAAACALVLGRTSSWASAASLVSALALSIGVHSMFNLFISLEGTWELIACGLSWGTLLVGAAVIWVALRHNIPVRKKIAENLT
ncbi:MAG: hypothetical protein Q4D06_09145 [Coriobacteriia bacterium]|nr:hypothetical protein [Coriobacteriia bacterium]